jgi:hypothetical protein
VTAGLVGRWGVTIAGCIVQKRICTIGIAENSRLHASLVHLLLALPNRCMSIMLVISCRIPVPYYESLLPVVAPYLFSGG